MAWNRNDMAQRAAKPPGSPTGRCEAALESAPETGWPRRQRDERNCERRRSLDVKWMDREIVELGQKNIFGKSGLTGSVLMIGRGRE